MVRISLSLKDKLYLGGTLGIPIFSYERTRTYRELDNQDNIPLFNQYSYEEELEISGSGVNLGILGCCKGLWEGGLRIFGSNYNDLAPHGRFVRKRGIFSH